MSNYNHNYLFPLCLSAQDISINFYNLLGFTDLFLVLNLYFFLHTLLSSTGTCIYHQDLQVERNSSS